MHHDRFITGFWVVTVTRASLPGPHFALFAPVYTPTIKTGITMTAMALDLLK